MSRKTFCDVCTKEITPENEFTHELLDPTGRAPKKHRYPGLCASLGPGDARVNVIHSSPGKDGHVIDLCKHCAIDAVMLLDDRPQPIPLTITPVSEVVRAPRRGDRFVWKGYPVEVHDVVETDIMPTSLLLTLVLRRRMPR